MRKMNRVFGAIVVVTLLSACSGTTTKSSGVSLEQRSVERWQKLIDGDLTGAYAYLSEGTRSVMTAEQYASSLRGRQIKWTGIEFTEEICKSETQCIARLLLSYTYAMPAVGEVNSRQPLSEDWVKTNGVWYFVPDQ